MFATVRSFFSTWPNPRTVLSRPRRIVSIEIVTFVESSAAMDTSLGSHRLSDVYVRVLTWVGGSILTESCCLRTMLKEISLNFWHRGHFNLTIPYRFRLIWQRKLLQNWQRTSI